MVIIISDLEELLLFDDRDPLNCKISQSNRNTKECVV